MCAVVVISPEMTTRPVDTSVSQATPLSGRLHLDRRNSFALAETGLAGLIEQARVAKVDLQQMARTTTGTGITSMQLETACRDGLLIPYRKQEPEAFKSALELLHT